MKIAIGSDHRGSEAKTRIVSVLHQLSHEVFDAGPHSRDSVDYPDFAFEVARAVSEGRAERGILICGTGIGMCIAANKVHNIRAAPCHDCITAEMSRRHNNANVLCLSADLLGEELIDRMLRIWLETPFEGGRHARRVEKIIRFESKESAAVQVVALNRQIEELGEEIQRRKQAEEAARQQQEALRASEARFHQLADAMPQIVWTAGPDGIVDYSNRRWHEFTASTIGVGNEGWSAIIHPEDMPAASKKWAESFRSGTLFEMEIRLLDHRTGGYRWHLIRTVPVRDDAGAAVRWHGTATDINDQKQVEDAALFLAESSAALAGLVDYQSTLQKVANLAVPHFADWSAVDVVGDDGKLRRLAVAHRDAKKIQLAKELLDRYPPDPDAAGGTHHVIRTGAPVTVHEVTDEMLVKAAKDEEHLRMIRALGLRSYICVPLIVSGAAFGALTFATAESGRTYSDADVTLAQDLSRRAAIAIENANLYRALKEADRRKNEFLALLSHELRNPLAPLRNGLQIIRLAGGNGQAVEQARSMMERQMQHLVRLVEDLLDVSRISRGKIELRKERVEAAEVVSSALETCDPILRQFEHDVTLTMPDQPIYVDADKTRLTQAVCNLLTNAAKYTTQCGRIWLTVQRQDREVLISVKDSGVGIPAAMLPRVFDMFAQVDRSLEKSHGGLGIGLNIVKRLIELHGGTVEAKSEGHGMGSEFLIRLPVALSVVHEENEGDEAEQQAGSGPRHRILVVDDSVDAASSLALMLKMMGNDVRTAHNGLEGVEAAEAFRPDLILLDIGMPKLNGYDACRRIRQQPWGKNIVIAALTGWGQDEDKRQSQDAGFNLHMVKPPDPAVIERLLATLKAGVG